MLRVGITGGFGVPGENDNGRNVIDLCAERALSLSDTHFEHRSLQKYTRVARGQYGVEVMNMKNLELVKKDMLRYVGCKCSERNGKRALRSSCWTV